jgi:hypothetical protein
VTEVLCGEALTLEYVAEVTAAVRAEDFNPNAVCIDFPPNSPFNLIVETWPTAMRVKLVLGFIQWCFAAATDINAGFKEVVVLPRERHLRTFINDDSLFFWRQRMIGFWLFGHGAGSLLHCGAMMA